jgi:hypothetical protein
VEVRVLLYMINQREGAFKDHRANVELIELLDEEEDEEVKREMPKLMMGGGHDDEYFDRESLGTPKFM